MAENRLKGRSQYGVGLLGHPVDGRLSCLVPHKDILPGGIALLKSLCYEYEGFQKPPKVEVEKEES
ncbi:MAG: hypothetical protein A2V52_05025 [Actinobacteria bacterium RBG_19FT_COMBO_54_7]|uniref:Uncharacterized protein n=1 Tax=Candidatus Solincola sediminis TaxID=1797199 RepID=A0A1F2WHF3_9ACTN|nr:MAG: hypothetical protein A2Y75_03535 [Candidatus Solincola sediminis]OFW58785.1 MAG: hypothetical protein A2W01_01490 [Candidatus Solincola sediminis]OFW70295.1 MAG: hypothetical protein A2V52_05025 [Actinobacteria bacterium RBG_19FT_COMBO_54_7]